jgi:cation-transporting ATPase E
MEPSVELSGPGASRLTGLPPGLSQREADARRRGGEANVAVTGSSRSYTMILRTNVFSFYNSILFVIGGALLVLGRFNDAFVSVGLGLVNAVISSLQELRAKRKLDRLQLLNRAVVRVVRDGRDVELLPELVVRGDLLHVRPGDQVVVDGPVVGDGFLEVDESLLTGESDAVVKRAGDDLFSGSFCVGGTGYQLARDVGAASYANRLTAEAGRSTVDKTPLQRRIAFVVRLVMVLVALMSSAILLQAALEGLTLLRVVQTSAVLSGLVPYGMFFLIAVAYTVGATKIAGQGALIQQVNAVESISNIDVLCTDKTGTLTSGRLALKEVGALGSHDPSEIKRLLGSMARSASAANTTIQAMTVALPGEAQEVRDEVTFTSTLRWSAVATAEGTWVLGAHEALAPMLGGERRRPRGSRSARARVRQGHRTGGPLARLAGPSRPSRTGAAGRGRPRRRAACGRRGDRRGSAP